MYNDTSSATSRCERANYNCVSGSQLCLLFPFFFFFSTKPVSFQLTTLHIIYIVYLIFTKGKETTCKFRWLFIHEFGKNFSFFFEKIGLFASKLGKKRWRSDAGAENWPKIRLATSWRFSRDEGARVYKGEVSNHLANHASQPPAHPATQTSRCSSVYQTCRNKVPAWFLRACTGVANST